MQAAVAPTVDVRVLARWEVQTSGNGRGRITSEDGTIDCGSRCVGELTDYKSFKLRATPDPGSLFIGWFGDCRGRSDCTMYVEQVSKASAHFVIASDYQRPLDVDGDGRYDALTDGLLAIRYLSGITGPDLVSGALGANATRRDPGAISAYLDGIRPLLNVDGYYSLTAVGDGQTIVRYLFGLRGPALLGGAQVYTGYLPQIEAAMATLMKPLGP